MLEFPAEPVWVATARLFASSVARQVGCSEDAVEELKLGISESCGILVRASDGGDGLHLSLAPDGRRLLVEVTGGDPLPEGTLGDKADTPESFASATSADVLRSLFPDAEIGPVSGASRVAFRLRIDG